MVYGLVLAGGGVRGAFQIGVWKALMEMKIEISAITGTSIGAVNAAILAQGDYKRALRLWRGISAGDIVDLPEEMNGEKNIFKLKNIGSIIKEMYKNDGLDMSPLKEILEEVIDEEKLRKSRIDFGAAAFSVTQKKEIYKFKSDIDDGDIVDFIMASASLIGFKKTVVDKDQFMDGGILDNMPVNMLLDKGFDNIITVDVKGIGFNRSFFAAGKNIISIRCKTPKTGLMEFDRDGIERSIQEGYQSCLKAFGRAQGKIYCFSERDYTMARKKYSAELIEGIEEAAEIFEIDTAKMYTFDNLVKLVLEKYEYLAGKINGSENFIEKIRKSDSSMLVARIVYLLENKKDGFIKEKLSVLGTNYDAASAILYFKKLK